MVIVTLLIFQHPLAQKCGRVDNSIHIINISQMLIKSKNLDQNKNILNSLSTKESFLSTVF